MRRFGTILTLALAPVFGGAVMNCIGTSAQEEQTQGPMTAPPKFEVKRLPSVPHPDAPPVAEQEIIRRFAANEDVMQKAYDTYNFTETLHVEVLTDPGGNFAATGEIHTKPDGKRYWGMTAAPVSTLKEAPAYTMEQVRPFVNLPLFVLTTAEIGNYNLLYAGHVKLDDLDTYVFQVKPKTLSRTRRFFEGVIWVDDRDFAIVKSYGKFVSDAAEVHGEFPFTMFETYRENFQEKYWLPTYTTSDQYANWTDIGEVHLRLVIRATDFKQQAPTAAPAGGTPAAAAAAAATPASSTQIPAKTAEKP